MRSCIASHVEAWNVRLTAGLAALDGGSEVWCILKLESQLLDELSRGDIRFRLVDEEYKLVVRPIREIHRHQAGFSGIREAKL